MGSHEKTDTDPQTGDDTEADTVRKLRAFRKLRRPDHEFEGHLDYTVNIHLAWAP